MPDSASASPFGYAADSPLDRTDPTGHYVTAYSGPLTPAQQRQEARIQKASISAAANAGARQAAAARTAPLDAHQLHLLHLAHLTAAGQSAKAAPVKKPAAAPVKPYDGPVTCAEGALTQCMAQAYAASGGQFDANGIPNGKGYTAPVLSPAQVKQQDNAARQARKQATANLEYDLKAESTKTVTTNSRANPAAMPSRQSATSLRARLTQWRMPARVQASTKSTFKVPSIPGRTRRLA